MKGTSMKNLASIGAAILLLGSSAALAQRNDSDGNRGDAVQQGRDYNQSQNRDTNDNQRGDARNDNQRGKQVGKDNQAQGAYRYQNERDEHDQFLDAPHWSRGDRLSSQYQGSDHVVSDWKAKHLRQPPRGYHWVRVDDRYMLATVAGGLIADVIMASQYGR
jgi:Ni/Co efflux regulator RcnB